MSSKPSPRGISYRLLHPASWSISAKVTIILLSAALLPMFTFTQWSLQTGLDRISQLEQQKLKLLAATVSKRLDQWIHDRFMIVDTLASDHEIVALIAGSNPAQNPMLEDITEKLKQIAGTSSEVSSVYLMDNQARFIAATNPRVVGRLMPERDYFQQASIGQRYVSDFRFGSTSMSPGIYFSSPIHKAQGDIVGVAVLKMEGSVIYDILNEAATENISPFLVNRDGIILYHHDPRLRFHSLRQLPPTQIDITLEEQNFPVSRIENLNDEMLAGSMLQARQPGYVRHQFQPQAAMQITGFSPLSNQTWIVGLSTTEREFIEPINALFWQTMTSMILLALMLALLSLWLAHYLAQPIAMLTQASRRLEKGLIHEYSDHTHWQIPLEWRKEVVSAAIDGLEISSLRQRQDELGQLAGVFEKMAVEVALREEYLARVVALQTRELTEKNAQLRNAQQRIEEELNIARGMQLAILPTEFPDHAHYQVDAIMRPAYEIGGDFYDFFILDASHIGLLIADVSGKGVPAAFFMAISRTIVQSIAMREHSPAAILAAANNTLCGENPREMFVTLFLGVLNIETGRLIYANGGHNPPAWLREGQKPCTLPSLGDTALGIIEDLDYQEGELILAPGDGLVLYTDGVTEAFNAQNEVYSEARLLNVLESSQQDSARQLVHKLVDSVYAFVQNADQSDDLTLLTLRYQGQPIPSTELNLRLRNEFPEIDRLLKALECFFQDHQLDQNRYQELRLVLDELLTNTISYGYPDGRSGTLEFQLRLENGTLDLRLRDDGIPFNPLEEARQPDLDADLDERPIGGLGIYLVKTKMDHVHYLREAGFNQLTLSKNLES